MALTTGTGLTNGSDFIEAVKTHLAAEGLTTVLEAGSVGGDNKELWMHLPAANTFNGIDILIGFDQSTTDKTLVTLSYFNPTEALLTPPGSPAGGRNSFLRVLGITSDTYATNNNVAPPGNSGDIYPNGEPATGVNGDPAFMNQMNQGANYLNHWIFTPESSPVGSTQWYCYGVVEVTTGVYRSFALGEGIKLGGSGWTGGLFVSASAERLALQGRSQWTLAGDQAYNGFGHLGEGGFLLNLNNDHYLNQHSPSWWNPWMMMANPWATNWVACAGTGPRALGEDFMELSPPAFSGEAIRVAARFYGMNLREDFGNNRMRPLIECPDFFHMNIGSVSPGDTVTDDGESFLVVPYHSKSGSNNSGNFGFLIRNPGL